MPDLNKVLLMGRLTRDPQSRTTSRGQSVCELSMAVNRSYKQGEQQLDETCFVNVTVWGKMAEACAKCIAKGSLVLVEGRLKLDQWEKDGQKRSKLGVVAESVTFMDRAAKPRQDWSAQEAKAQAADCSAPDQAPGDADIPF